MRIELVGVARPMLVVSLAIGIGACASTGGETVRVEERSSPPPVVEIPPQARVEVPEPAPQRAPSPAVESLLAQALAASKNGDHGNAVSLLERAQRIEPRNPLVWNRLALERLQEGRYAQAESLALKSNLYAAGAPDLRLRNWRVIAEARRKQGNSSGARDAERQASAIAGGR